jgi:hypothetical protein
MPFLWPILGGIAVTWLLRETEMAIPAFIWFWILIALMLWWPAGAAWFVILTVALGVLAFCAAFWEHVVGVILGFFMFFMFVVAFISAIR